MLIALIADVHSNAVALNAVLEALDCIGVEKILHAGDIIGYNPYPNETIKLFIKYNIISILGNHDRALIEGDSSGFNPYAATALEWTGNVISQENIQYISKLNDIESFKMGERKIIMVHGSPRDPDEYVYPEDAIPGFISEADAGILVLGHTHVQFIREYPEGIIVNPGSVGQPRDGNPDAGFAILDTDSGKIKLKRIGYDIEKVIDDILAARLPEKLAMKLKVGF